MKKWIAVLAALGMISLLAGCKSTIDSPDAPTGETVADISAQDVSESETQAGETTTAVPAESTTVQTETTTAAPSSTTEKQDTASYIKPTELVTYSAEGIPISNAYYSLKLPAEWNGHYLSATNYTDNVMVMTFRELSSAESGAGGTLFSLALVPEGAGYEAAGMKKLQTLSDDDADTYTLYAVYPADTQYTPQTQQQYALMQDQIDSVLKTLEPGAGFHF